MKGFLTGVIVGGLLAAGSISAVKLAVAREQVGQTQSADSLTTASRLRRVEMALAAHFAYDTVPRPPACPPYCAEREAIRRFVRFGGAGADR